jgi:phi13 family phage major tail protein
MDQKYGEFVNVDSLYAAVITEDSETTYAAGTPEYLAPAAEVAGEATVNVQNTSYDGVPSNSYVTEGATALALTVSGIPADKAAKYLGKHYDAATGRVLDTGKPKPPDCALSFRFEKGANENYRYFQYLKGKFSGGTEEAASASDGNVDIRTYQMTFTAITTTHKWTVDGVFKPMKRIFADTTDSAFDPTGWFTQVQTPDTTSEPDAIALSSIVPDDEATGVAVGANIVLTFNNKIASEAITVISEAGALVAAAKSWDAAGKILTINPDANLAASTGYIVAVAGVTDIYGQQLAAAAKNFETA